MILPEFCKADAHQTILYANELMNTYPKNPCPDALRKFACIMVFLEEARAAAPLIPHRKGFPCHGFNFN
jgi:hypothetical protein